MTTLSKDEVVRLAREAGAVFDPRWGIASNTGTATFERFVTLCRAPLVAENAALNADMKQMGTDLSAIQEIHNQQKAKLYAELADWKARALKAEQAGDRAVPDAEDYDLIDRYLRNNLDDADYGEYLAALDRLVTPQPAAQEPTSAVPVVEQLVEALERLLESVIGVDQVSAVNDTRAAIDAGRQYLKEIGK